MWFVRADFFVSLHLFEEINHLDPCGTTDASSPVFAVGRTAVSAPCSELGGR